MEIQSPQTIQQPPNKSSRLIYFLLWLVSTTILAIILTGRYGDAPFFNARLATQDVWGFLHATTGTAANVLGTGLIGFIPTFIVCLVVKKWRNMESVFMGATIVNAVIFALLFL